jgi:hypothetical protein
MEQIKRESFRDGVRYALEYLADLYEGLDETDLWTDYMQEEESE